ncbi:MAG: peptidyl-prolyl cis-trans isomerase [Oscillospiraceae bacterium]|nr:peptidyl-prolyl cis-trans isomerase [Oscillospiraceae bacterium]
MTKKLIALALCLCMIFAMAGCSSSKIETYSEDDTASATTEPDASVPTDDEEADTDTAVEAQGYAAFDADEIVGTVNGSDVTWREYYYWLNYYTSYVQYLAASYGVTLSGWDAYELSSSYTNAEVVILNAQSAVSQYRAVEAMAEDYGVTLDEEDEELMESTYQSDVDTYAGDGDGEVTDEEIAAFEEYLAEQFMDLDLYNYLNKIQYLDEDLFLYLYGEDGSRVTDEEVAAYVEQNGLMAAKHILLMTVDSSTGEALTDEEIAEKEATIEELYAQLTAVEDQDEMIALFDELTAEYTEDTGYAYYPDGYIFAEGEMVEEFEDAVEALEEYQLSEIVESSYGYHIILRIPVDADATYTVSTTYGSYSLRYYIASDTFTALLDAYTTTAQNNAVWNDGFGTDTMELAAIFEL